MIQQDNRNAKASTKARPQEQHSLPLRVSNRFAALSKAPAKKPKRALVIGDPIRAHEISWAFRGSMFIPRVRGQTCRS